MKKLDATQNTVAKYFCCPAKIFQLSQKINVGWNVCPPRSAICSMRRAWPDFKATLILLECARAEWSQNIASDEKKWFQVIPLFWRTIRCLIAWSGGHSIFFKLWRRRVRVHSCSEIPKLFLLIAFCRFWFYINAKIIDGGELSKKPGMIIVTRFHQMNVVKVIMFEKW